MTVGFQTLHETPRCWPSLPLAAGWKGWSWSSAPGVYKKHVHIYFCHLLTIHAASFLASDSH